MLHSITDAVPVTMAHAVPVTMMVTVTMPGHWPTHQSLCRKVCLKLPVGLRVLF